MLVCKLLIFEFELVSIRYLDWKPYPPSGGGIGVLKCCRWPTPNGMSSREFCVGLHLLFDANVSSRRCTLNTLKWYAVRMTLGHDDFTVVIRCGSGVER